MPTKSATAFSTHNDLKEDVRKKAIDLLNKHLAATTDLWTQIKFAHWNVKGPNFYQLHLLFDEVAGVMDDYIDLVAERVTSLGGVAMGTCRMAAKESFLPEYDTSAHDGREHVVALVERLAQYGKSVREAIDTAANFGDADTADIFTEISREVDKKLWFLESHLH